MAVQLLRRRFTVREYHQMGLAGILGENDRLELLEGEIVEMAPIGSRHQAVDNRLNEIFTGRVADTAIVSLQGPVRLAEHSKPQPNFCSSIGARTSTQTLTPAQKTCFFS